MYNIPIFINNKDNLTDLQGLVEDLTERGYNNIHIMDNDSTYPPLLDYYYEITKWYPEEIIIHRFPNHGDKCLWNSGLINIYATHPYIVLTTSDIRINPKAPNNFIELMINKLKDYPTFDKIGLSLALDFELECEYQQWSRDWEQQFWQVELEKDLYQADVDTTFNVFKPGPHKYQALRIAGDFTAKHMTWYVDFNKPLPEQEQYYLDRATNESTYKQFYTRHLDNLNS